MSVTAQNLKDSTQTQQSRFYNGKVETKRSADLDKEPKIREYIEKSVTVTNRDSILFYRKKALKLIESSGDDYFLPQVYMTLSDFYLEEPNDTLTLKYTNLCLELAKKHHLKTYLFRSCHMLGSLYEQSGNYNLALENYKLALSHAEDRLAVMQTNLSLARIYINTNHTSKDPKKYDVAKVFLKEIEAYMDSVPNTDNIHLMDVFYYANISLSILENNYDKKVHYAKESIKHAYTLDSVFGPDIYSSYAVSNSQNALARVYFEANKLQLAKEQLQVAIPFSKQRNQKTHIARNYTLMAMIHYKLNDYYNTIAYLDSMKPYDANKSEAETIDSLYYRSYLRTKNYKQAAIYSEKYIALIDSINRQEKQNAFIEYGKKYQTEKQIQENEILKQENEIKNLTIVKERNRRYFLLALVALTLVILLILFSSYKSKQRTAKILQEKNKTISVQNIELEESNTTKQKFFSIISHDLVNPFNAMLGYVRLLNNDYDDFTENERRSFISKINNAAEHNYKLVKSLLTWGRTQQNTIVVNKEKLSCKSLIDSACEPFLTFAEQKDINISNNTKTDLQCFADKNMMITSLGNIINNAIKFTPKEGSIVVEAYVDSDRLYFAVKDSGVGMSQKQMDNLFTLDKVSSSKGTNDEKGTGLGLMIVKEFMEKQGGEVLVTKNTPKGTVVKLALPIE